LVAKPGSEQPVSTNLAPYVRFFTGRRDLFRNAQEIADVAILRSFASQVYAGLTEQAGCRLVHLVNYYSPVTNAAVNLRMPPGKAAQAVRLTSPEHAQGIDLAFEQRFDSISFNVPRVNIYEMAVVEFRWSHPGQMAARHAGIVLDAQTFAAGSGFGGFDPSGGPSRRPGCRKPLE
jgi:hypothetical protein